MLFKKKEYLGVPLSSMYIYENSPTNVIGGVSSNDFVLTDSTEVKLFFEYTPKNLHDLGIIREFVTGTSYRRSWEIKLTPGYLFSEKTQTACRDRNIMTVKVSEIKQYMKELKDKKLYKEYVEKIQKFYQCAMTINNDRNELNGPTK